MIGIGALLGLALGMGGHLVITGSGPWFARAYVLRIERHLNPAPPAGWDLDGVLGRVRAQRVEERQARAGLPPDASAHVLGLALGAALGLVVGTGALALFTVMGAIHQPLAALPFLLVSGASGWLLADRRLDVQARHRTSTAMRELPSVAESLAIAVGAGAGLTQACEIVARESEGVLAGELEGVVSDIAAGRTTDAALAAMASRIPTPAISRFIDAMRIALDRGTPIVEVLHAQAADARHESRRALMEAAGRREIGMLIPVVFCVLPAVVVIALYPGFRELTSMV